MKIESKIPKEKKLVPWSSACKVPLDGKLEVTSDVCVGPGIGQIKGLLGGS